MSLDRRKPFARLQPNDTTPSEAAPTPATATARLTISRPRRQMPTYHYQHQQYLQNPQKRYATMIPGSSRSSATSSAESLYSTAGSVPRRRKLSAAEDVAARVRARWAALEALERAGASRSGASTSHFHSAPTTPNTRRRRSPYPHTPSSDAEKENAVPMQVDTYEKPLPPRPPALALHISAPLRSSTGTGFSLRGRTYRGCWYDGWNDCSHDGYARGRRSTTDVCARSCACCGSGARRINGPHDADEPYVRRDGQRESRPTASAHARRHAAPGPAARVDNRRARGSREFSPFFHACICGAYADATAERGSDAHDAAESTYGRSAALSASRMRRAAWWRKGAHVPFAYTCCWCWVVCVCAVRGRV
jgi:hypothetical protein